MAVALRKSPNGSFAKDLFSQSKASLRYSSSLRWRSPTIEASWNSTATYKAKALRVPFNSISECSQQVDEKPAS
jgi:hypothetical protein